VGLGFMAQFDELKFDVPNMLLTFSGGIATPLR